MDNNLPVIPKKLLSKVKALILKFCCNIDGGNCLRLDDGIPARCPQIGAPRVICKWFCDAILPGDEEINNAIMVKDKPGTSRTCAMCGKTFKSTRAAQKYCPACKPKADRQKARERKRRQRGV